MIFGNASWPRRIHRGQYRSDLDHSLAESPRLWYSTLAPLTAVLRMTVRKMVDYFKEK